MSQRPRSGDWGFVVFFAIVHPRSSTTNAFFSGHPSPTVDLPSKLAQLQASATKEYSLKNYPAAAELYSEAAEVQDEINGEMSPENADLLYQYGKCLYHVAVSNSDVLGGKVAGEEPKRKKRKTAASSSAGAAQGSADVKAESSGGLIGDALKIWAR